MEHKKAKPKIKKKSYNTLNVEFSNEVFEIPYDNVSRVNNAFFSKFKKNKYHIQFIISLIIAVIATIILFLNLIDKTKKELISKKILNNYTLTTLYQSENNSYVTEQISNDPFVIGMIRIDEINLNYPILSKSDSDFLKISLCRFAGPMPNETGNLCIAGHNYVDYRFFSRLNELEKNDTIDIFDLSGQKIVYSIYDIFENNPSDLSCTNQDVGDNKIITLLTCNNVNGKRLIIKAKAI